MVLIVTFRQLFFFIGFALQFILLVTGTEAYEVALTIVRVFHMMDWEVHIDSNITSLQIGLPIIIAICIIGAIS